MIQNTEALHQVREEAKKSIEDCKRAGIKVLMITGDHPLTAFKIAKDLNLTENKEEVITGVEIEEAFKKGRYNAKVNVIRYGKGG